MVLDLNKEERHTATTCQCYLRGKLTILTSSWWQETWFFCYKKLFGGLEK
jgi:hypothetical protein